MRSKATASSVLRIGRVELNPKSYKVSVNGEQVRLAPSMFRLLEFLMRNPGTVFSRRELQKSLWPDNPQVSLRTIDVNILRLRRKIEDSPGIPTFIRSTPGFGYGIEAPGQEKCTCSSRANGEMPSTRQHLHRLVDELPGDEIHAAQEFLEYLCEKRAVPA
jgi:DNA-binding winged helix-turn-helix (wHTH) protein